MITVESFHIFKFKVTECAGENRNRVIGGKFDVGLGTSFIKRNIGQVIILNPKSRKFLVVKSTLAVMYLKCKTRDVMFCMCASLKHV